MLFASKSIFLQVCMKEMWVVILSAFSVLNTTACM